MSLYPSQGCFNSAFFSWCGPNGIFVLEGRLEADVFADLLDGALRGERDAAHEARYDVDRAQLLNIISHI